MTHIYSITCHTCEAIMLHIYSICDMTQIVSRTCHLIPHIVSRTGDMRGMTASQVRHDSCVCDTHVD